jgi:hypothetical protein
MLLMCWGDLWRSALVRLSPMPVMSVPPVVWFEPLAARIFQASNEQVVRGFLRVFWLPPLLQMVMVHYQLTSKINSQFPFLAKVVRCHCALCFCIVFVLSLHLRLHNCCLLFLC